MPITKINYQNTIMYKVVCNDLTIKDVYVGNTTDFIRRKSEHKRPSKTDTKLNIIIKDNGGWENWEMLEIEKFPCLDGNEAKTRLRFWYEQLNANINTCRPIATKEEKQAYGKKITVRNKPKTKEDIQKYRLEWNRLNKDKILEHKKTYKQNKKLKELNNKTLAEANQIASLDV